MSVSRYEPEAELMIRQGGFTPNAWAPITEVIEEYRQHRQLDPSTMLVRVLLRNRDEMALAGVRVAFTYTVLLTEDDSMRIVPNTEIIGVDIARRPGPAPERQPVGFTYERVKEGSPVPSRPRLRCFPRIERLQRRPPAARARRWSLRAPRLLQPPRLGGREPRRG
jgi:hypothetical protein